MDRQPSHQKNMYEQAAKDARESRLADLRAKLAQAEEDVRLGDEMVDEWKKQCRIARQQRDQALTTLVDARAERDKAQAALKKAIQEIGTWSRKAGYLETELKRLREGVGDVADTEEGRARMDRNISQHKFGLEEELYLRSAQVREAIVRELRALLAEKEKLMEYNGTEYHPEYHQDPHPCPLCHVPAVSHGGGGYHLDHREGCVLGILRWLRPGDVEEWNRLKGGLS